MTSKIDQIEVEAAAAELGGEASGKAQEKKFAVLEGHREVEAWLR